MLNSNPDLAARVAHLGNYFHDRGQADQSVLPLEVRTFVTVILSREPDCVYEWAAWSGRARETGTRQEIDTRPDAPVLPI